jgi:hypothetical protein
MKRISIILLTLTTCFFSFAEQRGVTFEKDGLVYTIASEYQVWRRVKTDVNWGTKYVIKNEGEVYVSGITTPDSIVKIPAKVSYPTSYCRNVEDTATYQVLGIGESVFEGAVLKDLILPYGLKFIGDRAFSNMTLTSGLFVVHQAKKMGANLFDGMKTKIFSQDLDFLGLFDKTFENKENLPEVYTSHQGINLSGISMDKRFFYTIGTNIISRWLSNKTIADIRDQPNSIALKIDPYYIYTIKDSEGVKIRIRPRKNFEKINSDIDMLPPYEFECRNPYTNKKEVFQEVAINENIFRGKKNNDYFYFTSDGRPLKDIESLLDSSGKDPFGRQVIPVEELKAKKEANEREKKLDKKLNDLKSTFGF